MDVAAAASIPRRLPDLLPLDRGVTPRSSTSTARARADPPLRRDPAPPPARPDRPAEDGIARERALTAPLRSAPTASRHHRFTPAELRDELRRRYGGDSDQPVLTIASFGFARGISRTADLVFDLRFLPIRTGSTSFAR
jgi:UPF0042 nucleotide-binding protein